MTQHSTEPAPPRRESRLARFALPLAVLALGVSVAHWYTGEERARRDEQRGEDSSKLQRRLATLETRLDRERGDLDRLAQRLGDARGPADSLSARVADLEERLARQPGSDRTRIAWLTEQAEYFMRIANAQERLAGNTAGALSALAIADDYLREAADPRLVGVRERLAREMAALRAVPAVDSEGLALKLSALAGELERLPRRQEAPDRFEPVAPAPGEAATAAERAWRALRAALAGVVSIRRTEEPNPTLLSAEAEQLLVRSLDLELQLARLALLRGEAGAYRAALGSVRANLERYFDAAAPEVAGALAAVDELGAVRLPESLPDISGSLTELVRVRAATTAP